MPYGDRYGTRLAVVSVVHKHKKKIKQKKLGQLTQEPNQLLDKGLPVPSVARQIKLNAILVQYYVDEFKTVEEGM